VLEGRRTGLRLGREIKIHGAPTAAETWRGEGFVGLTDGRTNRLRSVFGGELWDETLGHRMGGRQADLRRRRFGADGGTKEGSAQGSLKANEGQGLGAEASGEALR
jgi:hypothetical protein